MKKITCQDFGGPCDTIITGNSFDEAGMNCKNHVMEQIDNGDEAHKIAADKMRNATSEEQQNMWAEYKRKYEEAPEV